MSDSIVCPPNTWVQCEQIPNVGDAGTLPIYISMQYYFSASAITAWGIASYGPLVLEAFGNDSFSIEPSDDNVDTTLDNWYILPDSQPTQGVGFTAGWHTLEVFLATVGGTHRFAVDGTEVTWSSAGALAGVLYSTIRFGNVSPPDSSTVYFGRLKIGTSWQTSNIFDFNPSTASNLSAFDTVHGAAVLGTAPTPPPSIPAPASGTLYATKGGFGVTDTNLYIVNPVSVALTAVGATGHLFTGLAFDPTDSTLYGVTGNSGSNQRTLFTIDPLTAAVTSIGALGSTVADICFDDSGQMYGWKPQGASGGNNRLARINKSTGALTNLGASGLTSTQGCGISFLDGVLYAAPKGADGDLYSVDTTTGAVTDLGVMTGIFGDNISGMTTRSEVLWGICLDGIVFTVGAESGGAFPLTEIGTLPNDDNWDSIAAFPGEAPAPPEPSHDAGVFVAFGSQTLAIDPAYLGVENVQSWETHRGRQYELDKTQAGTAVITVIDQEGILDPTNSSSPFFGLIGPLSPAQIRAVNPTNQQTFPIYTGFVESWTYTMDTTERWMVATINLTDGFELLARAEVIPDANGTTTFNAQQVNDRINSALNLADWPGAPSGRNIFFGNVDLQKTIYNPQTSLLSVIQDAADAEFPNVANVFMDKWGRVAFRGRWARFNAEHYSPRPDGMTPPAADKQVNFWDVGDRAAAQTHGYAPITDLQWNLDLKNVINACLCYPAGIAQNLIAGQLRPTSFPTGSTTQYGLRSFSIPDLIVANSIANPSATPGGDGPFAPEATADEECQIFASYYIGNYGVPVEMISSITFSSLDPSDSLASALWHFITCVEIGDVVRVHTSDPGGGGFKNTSFFVEGIHNVVTNDLRGDVLAWKMNLDLTPRMWYSTFNGERYFP